MALPDHFLTDFAATAHVFGEAGASGVTATLTFEALASGSARMSAEVDLGATPPQRVQVELRIETGTAPTAGGTYDLYAAWSIDGTNYPGGVSGSDGAWPSDGNEDEWAVQLDYIGSLVVTNDGTTVQKQAPWVIDVRGRFLAVVVDNNTSQAVRDETTATDNDSRVIVTPIDDQIED